MKAFLFRSESESTATIAATDVRAVLRWLRRDGVTDVWLASAVGTPEELGAATEDQPRLHQVATGATGCAAQLAACGAEFVDEPFLVVEATACEFELRQLLAEHAANPGAATLAVMRVPETSPPVGRRVDMDRSGRLLWIGRAAVEPRFNRAPVGVSIIDPGLLTLIPSDRPDFAIDELFPMVLRRSGLLFGAEVQPRPPVGSVGPARTPSVAGSSCGG